MLLSAPRRRVWAPPLRHVGHQKLLGDVFIDLFFHMRLWIFLPTCMSKEPDGLTVLKDALGLMGLSDPKPLKSPLTSVKTHPYSAAPMVWPLSHTTLAKRAPTGCH